MEKLQLTNKILENSFFCHYRAKLNIENIIGDVSDYEEMHFEKRRNIIIDYEKLLVNKGYNLQADILSAQVQLTDKTYDKHVSVNLPITEIFFDFIEKSDGRLIPVYVVSTNSVQKWNKIFITCLVLILKQKNPIVFDYGKIVFKEKNEIKTIRIKFSTYEKDAKAQLQINFRDNAVFCLNKHCQICEYHSHCYDKATQLNHLSLLSKITSKKIKKYENRGIFTITQLSYLYRPRRKNKKQTTLNHSFELQALALRNDKIYIKQAFTFDRFDTELYLDIEGLPERNFYYLIGILLKTNNNLEYKCFWANNEDEEEKMWITF